MARKPSQRRNFKQEDMELNLTPMMNLIAILIPCLLISVAFVEVAIIKIAAPGSGPSTDAPPATEHPPLGLELTVTEKGFMLNTAIGALESDGKPGRFIPTVERTVSCARYVGTVPPPRTRNRAAPCANRTDSRSFTVYDLATLRSTLISLKDRFPDENRIIVTADPGLEFEAIVDALDTSREVVTDGEDRKLFDEVVVRPAML